MRRTVELVRQRCNAPNLPKVASPAAYFRTALRDRHADQKPLSADRPARRDSPAEGTDTAAEAQKVLAARINEAYALYREMDVEQQQSLREEFLQATPISGFKMELRRHGLAKSMALRAAFSDWLANKLWGNGSVANSVQDAV